MTVVDQRATTPAPLSPVTITLRAMFGTDDLPGLTPGLVVRDEAGWTPATDLVSGERLPEVLTTAARRWEAAPHAAAALSWKAYTYWLSLPAVLGWAAARRVPLLNPENVLIHLEDHRPLITIGLRRDIRVAVLPSDPLAISDRPDIVVADDEDALLGMFRHSLLDAHLTPLLGAMHDQVRIGARTLLGSVASSVAYAILRAADALPGSSAESIGVLLDALDVADLIELVPGPDGALSVQRKTCCLAFTLPRPKYCAGCCVRPS